MGSEESRIAFRQSIVEQERIRNAAPDLLEALEHVMECYWLSSTYTSDEFQSIPEIIMANKAIAKARGQ